MKEGVFALAALLLVVFVFLDITGQINWTAFQTYWVLYGLYITYLALVIMGVSAVAYFMKTVAK